MQKFVSFLREYWWIDLFRGHNHKKEIQTPADERMLLKKFLGLCLTLLVLTWTSNYLMSFYGQNPTGEKQSMLTPTPQQVILSPKPSITSPVMHKISSITPSVASVSSKPTLKACPMDAKLCPDGKTYVGRSGSNCEFATCPKN